MVSGVEYFMHNHMKQEIFDSCKDVINPQTGKPAMELMCSIYGAACTPEKFFESLGKTAPDGYSPFLISYSFANETTPDGYKPLDKELIRKCNEPIPVRFQKKNCQLLSSFPITYAIYFSFVKAHKCLI